MIRQGVPIQLGRRDLFRKADQILKKEELKNAEGVHLFGRGEEEKK